MEKAQRDRVFASKEALNYWGNVDLYIGGSEHGTGHLLYSRFWVKFLKDRGHVSVEEPFQKMINQGMILGTSAIAYRKSGTNTYVSAGLKDQHETEEIRIDVNLVDGSNAISIDAFKNWQPQFKDADFILEGEKFIVGREVEKMSKRCLLYTSPSPRDS